MMPTEHDYEICPAVVDDQYRQGELVKPLRKLAIKTKLPREQLIFTLDERCVVVGLYIKNTQTGEHAVANFAREYTIDPNDKITVSSVGVPRQ